MESHRGLRVLAFLWQLWLLLWPIINTLLLCSLIDDISYDSFGQFYSLVIVPVAASGLVIILCFLKVLMDIMTTTHPNDDIQGSKGATINVDPNAALPSGPGRLHNDAAADDYATPRAPFGKTPPEFCRRTSPVSSTDLFQIELISQAKDDAQGSNSATIDNDLHARHQHDAADTYNALDNKKNFLCLWLWPFVNTLLLCKLIDEFSYNSFGQFYSLVIVPVAACGLILCFLKVLIDMMTSHPNDQIQGSMGATISIDPVAATSELSRQQNHAAVYDIGHASAEAPLQEASPEFDRTTSPCSKTATLQTEFLAHPNDDAQGSNSATIDNDPDAPGSQRGLSRHQDDAAYNTALPALKEGSLPEVAEVELRHIFQRGVCKRVVAKLHSEKDLPQHLEISSDHNFCSECEEDLPSPSPLQRHLESLDHHFFWPCDNLASILGVSVLVLLPSVLALVLAKKKKVLP